MARRARHCVKKWNTVILFKYFFTFLYLSFTETLKKNKVQCYPDCCTGCPNEHRNSVTILICLCKWPFDLVMPIKKAVICLLELITYFFFYVFIAYFRYQKFLYTNTVQLFLFSVYLAKMLKSITVFYSLHEIYSSRRCFIQTIGIM